LKNMKKLLGLLAVLITATAVAQNLEVQDNGASAGDEVYAIERRARPAAAPAGMTVKVTPITVFPQADARYTTNILSVIDLIAAGTFPQSGILTYVTPTNLTTTTVAGSVPGLEGMGRAVGYVIDAMADGDNISLVDVVAIQVSSDPGYTATSPGFRANGDKVVTGDASQKMHRVIVLVYSKSYNARTQADLDGVLPFWKQTSDWNLTSTFNVAGSEPVIVRLGLVPPSVVTAIPKLYSSRLAAGAVRISAETNGNVGNFKLQSAKMLGGAFTDVSDIKAGQSMDIPAIAVVGTNAFYRLRRP
jgi:hypothetical protein